MADVRLDRRSVDRVKTRRAEYRTCEQERERDGRDQGPFDHDTDQRHHNRRRRDRQDGSTREE
jgi:hypothetical protein